MTVLVNPISLALDELLPEMALFSHPAGIHGRAHVARVMIHAFLLIEMLGLQEDAAPLWAAVYMHDLARTHDGLCRTHGADAVRKAEQHPDIRKHLARGGLCPEHVPAVYTAVKHHSLPRELRENHPHRRLTALLKDADGLDRVRIRDLDAAYLRFPQSARLAAFAEWLFWNTPRDTDDAPDFFSRMWEQALAGIDHNL